MAKVTTDSKTLALIKLVEQKRKEIKQAESPKWKTNLSIPYMSRNVNLNVESDVNNLASIVGYLLIMEECHNRGCKELGLELDYVYNGFSVQDWISDIKHRINKIQINEKRAQLDVLEKRLNNVISPELRAQMELDAIATELENA